MNLKCPKQFLKNTNITCLELKPRLSLCHFCNRGTRMILRLVPHEHTFQNTLRAVKLWAKGQGLYRDGCMMVGNMGQRLRDRFGGNVTILEGGEFV